MSKQLDALLAQTADTNALKTEMLPAPEGRTTGIATKVELKSFPAKEEGKPDSILAEYTFDLTDPAIAEAVERDKPMSRYAIFLDFDDTGALTNGNVGLGRLLVAADQT